MRRVISKAPRRPPRIVHVHPPWHPLSWTWCLRPWSFLRRVVLGRG